MTVGGEIGFFSSFLLFRLILSMCELRATWLHFECPVSENDDCLLCSQLVNLYSKPAAPKVGVRLHSGP